MKTLDEIRRAFIHWLDHETEGMSNAEYEKLLDMLIGEMLNGILCVAERDEP